MLEFILNVCKFIMVIGVLYFIYLVFCALEITIVKNTLEVKLLEARIEMFAEKQMDELEE